MRILILNRVEAPAPGATGRLVAELSAHLRDSGHTVQTITSGKMPPRTLLYLLSWLTIGIRAMFATRADRVIVMTDPPMLGVWIPFLKLRHQKVIYWCQDLYPDLLPMIGIKLPAAIQSNLFHLKRWTIKYADRTIVLGRCMVEKIAPYQVKNIAVIPNWTEQDQHAPSSLSDELTILYAGNLGRVHPVDAIGDAIATCARLPVKFILMIGGQNAAALRKRIGGQNNVTFLPPQPWYKAKQIQDSAHVHLVALRPEATGLAVPVKHYAAARAGRPVIFIGDPNSEIARHIIEHQCGTIIAPYQPEQFAEAVQSYLDKAHWRSHADAARRAHESARNSLAAVAETVLAA